jgi:hypothetical protein
MTWVMFKFVTGVMVINSRRQFMEALAHDMIEA